jgi:hypothetical protein
MVAPGVVEARITSGCSSTSSLANSCIRSATKPLVTGSVTSTNTIGIERVSRNKAATAASLSRPQGNTTGFTDHEPSLGGIEQTLGTIQKPIAAADERRKPLPVGIYLHPLVARRKQVRAGDPVGDGDGVDEYALHTGIGRERLALLHPDGREKPDHVRIDEISGFVLHHRIQLIIEAEGVRADRVELLARGIDELRCWRTCRFSERVNAGIRFHSLTAAAMPPPSTNAR